jgi:surface antigen
VYSNLSWQDFISINRDKIHLAPPILKLMLVLDEGDGITALKSWQHLLHKKIRIAKFIAQYFVRKFYFMFRSRAPKLKRAYTQNFPAVHMKVDGWQYATIFSSELLVVIAAVVVAGFNIWFFNFAHGADQSLAMGLLRNHTGLNDQLVLHSNTVRKVVVRPGFFQEAYAESLPDGDQSYLDNITLTAYEDNVMVKPNPDSVQNLVSKQVQVYTTESGDTLSTIAHKFGVSVNSIKWSNNLPSDTIKPGWFLLIPPGNGVVVKITDSNTTIPDLAKKYEVKTEEIVASNVLANAEDIPDVGQYLYIANGKVTPPPAPKVAAKTKSGKSNIVDNGKPVPGGHLFPKGYCTWYVATKVKVTWGGNANRWPANARAQGYTVDKNPTAGSIVETGESRVGHVAYVEKVDGDDIYISEMNYKGFGIRSSRVISKSIIRSVIHP